jgi:uncharacterized membrane protein
MFERLLAELLLRLDMPPMSRKENDAGTSAWKLVKAHMRNRVTWTSPLDLALKFPVTAIFFVIAVTLIAASVAMLIAPITYQSWDYATSRDVWWQIDSLWEALIVSILAVFVVGLISLYVTVRHQLAGQGVGSLGARNAGTVGGLARALIVR